MQVHEVGTETRQLARHGGTERHRGVTPELRYTEHLHSVEPLLDPSARLARYEYRNVEVASEPGAQKLHVLLDPAWGGREVVLEDVDDSHEREAYALRTRPAWASTPNSASARRRPAAPSRARSSGSRSRSTTLAANPPMSRGR